MAYMSHREKHGVTTKACQRSLANFFGRGYGATPFFGQSYEYSGAHVNGDTVHLPSPRSGTLTCNYVGADATWKSPTTWNSDGTVANNGNTNPVGLSDGGCSFLTMGEYRSKALSVVKPHEELEPLEIDHPLRRLMENPNPWDTAFDLAYELQMFEELTGVSYEWLVPNDYGMPCERWCIPSHWVWPRTGGGRPLKSEWDDWQPMAASTYVNPQWSHADELISYYEVRPWGGMGSAGILRIPPHEIIMRRWKSPVNKIDGYSKLAAIAQWIDTEESISKSRWAQFMNQARPEMWVELGPGYEDPDDNRIARIEAKFAAKIQGELNFGKPVITPPGTKITPLQWNPTEMSYFQCCDTETECLTSDGWKKYTELDLKTEVACFNPGTGKIEYARPSRIWVSDYKGSMHLWQNEFVDVMMTPNHRVVHFPQGSLYAVVLAGSITRGTVNVLTVGEKLNLVQEVEPEHRSVVSYQGNVWCVTVPTGMFVVRRNGKALVTGNSEEQIRNMILSAFQVPQSVVGITTEMTYGAILASLAAFSSYCINPRLRFAGETYTKHLGSRYDEVPDYKSTSIGVERFGGQSEDRRVRIWHDDTMPADPQQVNQDIDQDLRAGAITPNEIRAIRGRKPYRFGGDNPLVNSETPLLINAYENVETLAALMERTAAAKEGALPPGLPGGAPGGGMPMGIPGGGGGAAGGPPEAIGGGGAPNLAEAGAGIAEPNGPPKALKREVKKGLLDLATEFLRKGWRK
jgi:hypothetical protein